MTAKKAYEKPVVASNRIFSLTSSDCDVMLTIPGPCADYMMWIGCDFGRKSPGPDSCLLPPDKPIYKS
jgi:hypothetical protein